MSTVETISILAALALNLLVCGFWGGRISAKVASLDGRLGRIEQLLDRSS
jgi:hypothetical protein